MLKDPPAKWKDPCHQQARAVSRWALWVVLCICHQRRRRVRTLQKRRDPEKVGPWRHTRPINTTAPCPTLYSYSCCGWLSPSLKLWVKSSPCLFIPADAILLARSVHFPDQSILTFFFPESSVMWKHTECRAPYQTMRWKKHATEITFQILHFLSLILWGGLLSLIKLPVCSTRHLTTGLAVLPFWTGTGCVSSHYRRKAFQKPFFFLK